MKLELNRAKLLEPHLREEINEGDIILDFGCGSCEVGLYLSKKIGFKIYFADINNNADNDLTHDNFYLIRNNKFSFDKKFDIIMLNEVIHHIKKDQEIIDLINKLKKYTKKILITTIKPTIRGRLWAIFYLSYTKNKEQYLNIKKAEDWLKLFKDCKIKEVYSPCWYPLKHILIIIENTTSDKSL